MRGICCWRFVDIDSWVGSCFVCRKKGGGVSKKVQAYEDRDNAARKDNNPTAYNKLKDNNNSAVPGDSVAVFTQQPKAAATYTTTTTYNPPAATKPTPPPSASKPALSSVSKPAAAPINKPAAQGPSHVSPPNKSSQPSSANRPLQSSSQATYSSQPSSANRPLQTSSQVSYTPQSSSQAAPAANRSQQQTSQPTYTPQSTNKPTTQQPPAANRPLQSTSQVVTPSANKAPSVPLTSHSQPIYKPAAAAPSLNKQSTAAPSKAPVGGNPKINGLMQWVQQCTQGYAHVNINNFTTAWKDGMAFCALIHHHNPCFDYNALSPNNAAYNLKLAIDLAEKMGIPRLSDPEDFLEIDVPDRLSTITYLFGWSNVLNP